MSSDRCGSIKRNRLYIFNQDVIGGWREDEDGEPLPGSPIRPETFNLEEAARPEEEGAGREDEKFPSHSQVTLSEEQRQAIISSESFTSFFDWSTRVMERALGENNRSADIFRDYGGKEQLDEGPIKDKVETYKRQWNLLNLHCFTCSIYFAA